ncbi:MAG: serine/threonine-protein kinase [Pseudomonadota bacterium]
MRAFNQPAADDYALIYLTDTDEPLPATPNPATRYTHFKTIARGGKSLIQSCHDRHLKRVVCYKRLRPEFQDDPLEQRRLLREARVSAMLQHPNTVPTYELGRTRSGHYYFTMKLVHGYTLREVLDYRERYDLGQLLDVLIQVAQALDYAHSHRVLHRDLKPENVLVGPYGEVLLLDWGLAKVWEKGARGAAPPNDPTEDQPLVESSTPDDQSLTGAGALQGTPAYMSPEQIRREPGIDHRADVFSLGVLLYEILAGCPPVQGDNPGEVTRRIVEETPMRPSRLLDRGVGEAPPAAVEAIAMQCLEKEPARRIQGCAELVRRLQEVR